MVEIVDITGYSHEGAGVGRIAGQVVFIPGALVGERVLVEVSGADAGADANAGAGAGAHAIAATRDSKKGFRRGKVIESPAASGFPRSARFLLNVAAVSCST